MKVVRVVAIVLFILAGSSGRAHAQDNPKVELFGGYSFVRASLGKGVPAFNLNGGSSSVAFNFNKFVGVVADFGYYENGRVFGVPISYGSYQFGPKLTYRVGRVAPFAQVLFGGAYVDENHRKGISLAYTIGGGVDLKAVKYMSIRLIQAEYAVTRFPFTGISTNQNNLRLSTGVVFRFGQTRN